jgi:hypothetical protein
VLIEESDGVAVRICPLRWQFPSDAGAWDDRWLIIAGTVDLRGKAWSFTDPCLLIEEARELAVWLRHAAEGQVAPSRMRRGEQAEPSLSFLEPVLGFSIAAHRDTEVVVRVHFTAEAAPPWLRDKDPHSAPYVVELRQRPDELLAAATAWSEELDALPSRSFASTD